MKIAVLSGKGGTGKTTLSVNLAYVSGNFKLLDVDIEEPNAHLFLNPEIKGKKNVYTYYPVTDNEKCTKCGKCSSFCHYNAIFPTKTKVVVFKENCHFCGGCALVCPEKAITYEKRDIGFIYSGTGKNNVELSYGELKIGELSGVRIIKELKKEAANIENIIIDSPPGAACSVAESVQEADYAVLITEPTPFGVSDMKIVVDLLRNEKVNFGVVVNKSGVGNNEIYEYCTEENIEIIGEIPFETEIAEIYSKGKIISEKTEYREIFLNILDKINKRGRR